MAENRQQKSTVLCKGMKKYEYSSPNPYVAESVVSLSKDIHELDGISASMPVLSTCQSRSRVSHGGHHRWTGPMTGIRQSDRGSPAR